MTREDANGMSASEDAGDELAALLEDLLTESCTAESVETAENGWSEELWAALAELGLTAVGVDEDAGGSGGTLFDAAAVVRIGAAFAAPLPLGHTLITGPAARRLFGLEHRDGPTAVGTTGAVRVRVDGDDVSIEGTVTDVPYGRFVQNLILLGADDRSEYAVEIDARSVEWAHDVNLAGEPRDSAVVSVAVRVADAGRAPAGAIEGVRDAEALALSWAMVGALEKVRDLTVSYTSQREQFGRALSSFQAVKQLTAEIGGEVAVSAAAVSAATSVFDDTAGFAVAAARSRCAAAVAPVSRHGQQLHGAIGYTREYPLHQYTRRLWAWRDEGLSEQEWLRIAGERALAAGPEKFWETIVG